jgi:transposase
VEGVLSVEDWAEIRRLHRAEQMPVKAIARVMGVSRNTVRAAVASSRPPKYERPRKGSIVDAAEPRIRELLRAYPTMPATVVAERIGWERSVRVLRDRVAELRPAYLPQDPASRTAYAAGEIAQCDFWFPPIMLPVGCGQVRRPAQLPVLTMVCAYSRWLMAMLIPTRTASDLFAGWWQLIAGLGAVPRVLVWDGEGAIGRWRAGRPELTADCQAFRGTLGAKVVVCRPADPEAKGLIERAHDYLERSFLPGRAFAGRGGRWAAPRPSGSPPTRPRCWACRRWPRTPGGGRSPGCRGTTTCGWIPMTTPSTRPPSGTGSR